MKVTEIECKTALSKGGFEEGSYCINPYVGCGHRCVYCYARFIKRFKGIKEPWGEFVQVKKNIAEMLEKELSSPKYKNHPVFLGTVTDPYQPLEEKYKLTRKILQLLLKNQNPICIMTKSDMVLRDLDLLKQFKDADVSITVNTLDEKWKKAVEPDSPSVKERLVAAKKLADAGVHVSFMLGPYWPFFTDLEALFKEFKKAGAKQLFTESFNTIGGNWVGVEEAMKKHYPAMLPKMKDILFDKKKFYQFYEDAEKKVKKLSKEYGLPITIFFERGHAKSTLEAKK